MPSATIRIEPSAPITAAHIVAFLDWAITEAEVETSSKKKLALSGVFNGQNFDVIVTGKNFKFTTIGGDKYLSGGTLKKIEVSLAGAEVATLKTKTNLAELVDAVRKEATGGDRFAIEKYLSSFNWTLHLSNIPNNAPQGSKVGDGYRFNLEGKDKIFLGSADDVFFSGDGNDRMTGGGGNDRLDGGVGEDKLKGSAGDDRLNGGKDNDKLTGGSGNDDLYGVAGDDVLRGGPGDDKAVGGPGNDKIYGNDGSDLLMGNAGDDRLEGGTGYDKMLAGKGADEFVFKSAADSTTDNPDVIRDFKRAEGDLIDVSGVAEFDFIGASAFNSAAGELRYENVGNKTFVYGDIDGEGSADFAIRVRGNIDLAEGDFVL